MSGTWYCGIRELKCADGSDYLCVTTFNIGNVRNVNVIREGIKTISNLLPLTDKRTWQKAKCGHSIPAPVVIPRNESLKKFLELSFPLL